MSRKQMKGVPAHLVGEVVQSYVDEGFQRITCTRAGDGTWTVTASRQD